MKSPRTAAVRLAALLALLASASAASAAEIVVYEHANFRGASRTITSEVPNLRDLSFNDRVSSVRVVSGVWELCTDSGFRGRCETFDRDVANLEERGWNDAVSSLRPARRRDDRIDRRDRDRDREPGYDRDRRPPYGGRAEPGPDTGARIIVFDRPGFGGNRRAFGGVVSNLSDLDFNDRIESAQVTAGVWELCEDADFGGRCEIFDADEPDLRQMGLDRRVSSLRPVEGDAVPQRGERGPITVFQDADFRGPSRRLWRDVPDLRAVGFDRAISSVRIAGGGWELCEEPGYRGRCILLRNDASNLRDEGFNDRASSLRRVRGRY